MSISSGWKRTGQMASATLSFAVISLLLLLPWIDLLPNYVIVLISIANPFLIIILACILRLVLPDDDRHFMSYFKLYAGAVLNLMIALKPSTSMFKLVGWVVSLIVVFMLAEDMFYDLARLAMGDRDLGTFDSFHRKLQDKPEPPRAIAAVIERDSGIDSSSFPI